MLILPDQHAPKGKILLPLRRCEWMQPSQRRFTKPAFRSVEDHKFWILEARLHDGHVIWCGRFDDREDVDAFLFACVTGSIRYERELWNLSVPNWNADISEYDSTFYVFISQVLSSGAGSGNQTFNTPRNYNSIGSVWRVTAAGGSAGCSDVGTGHFGNAGGGGGAAFNQVLNLSLGGTATYNIPAGTTGGHVTSVNTAANGATGADGWFNGTTLGGSSVGSKGGGAGLGAVDASANGGAAGTAAGGVGSGNDGGRGGNATRATGSANASAGGGGGAGGPNAAGNQGGDTSTTNVAGGQGDGSSGGAGGTAGANAGSPGTEWGDGATGSGGGGGSQGTFIGGPVTGASGGNYGAGGGGAGNTAPTDDVTGGPGTQGVVLGGWTEFPLGAMMM